MCYVCVCVFDILISLRKKGLGRGRVRLLITNTLIRETKHKPGILIPRILVHISVTDPWCYFRDFYES